MTNTLQSNKIADRSQSTLRMMPQPLPLKLLNMTLRLAPMGAKLLLSLYMGRYLELRDIGLYGIVFGLVMVLNATIGMGLNYIVSREIVGAPGDIVGTKVRNQIIVSIATCLLCGLFFYFINTLHLYQITLSVALYASALGLAEAIGTQLNGNMIAAGFPIRANLAFFIRSAAWTAPAIAGGFYDASLKSATFILNCWLAGSYLSLAASIALWPGVPWGSVIFKRVDWRWIIVNSRKTVFIWIGSIGVTAGSYVDRFAVDHFLGLEYTGVTTFFFSFSNALPALIQSGILAFVCPRLITLHRDGDAATFRTEITKTIRQVLTLGGSLALLMTATVFFIVHSMGRALLIEGLGAFSLLMIGAWIRGLADTFHYVLYARHQDRAIWVGNILYLVPALGLNFLLLPHFGLISIGISSIVSSMALLSWRTLFSWSWKSR